MLKTFFNELTTQSNTAFSLGTRFKALSGLNTLNTRRDFIVFKFLPGVSLSLNTNAIRAHNTTIASRMFHTSRKYEPG